MKREKNSETGRGGVDQSTSRSASTRSSAVTELQSIAAASAYELAVDNEFRSAKDPSSKQKTALLESGWVDGRVSPSVEAGLELEAKGP